MCLDCLSVIVEVLSVGVLGLAVVNFVVNTAVLGCLSVFVEVMSVGVLGLAVVNFIVNTSETTSVNGKVGVVDVDDSEVNVTLEVDASVRAVEELPPPSGTVVPVLVVESVERSMISLPLSVLEIDGLGGREVTDSLVVESS